LPPEQALIHVRGWDGKEFGELGRRKGSAKARQGVVTVTLGSYMQSRDAVEPRYLECSFVIDCDEPIFQELNQQIARDVSPKPTIEQLVRFVDGYIANKNNRRGFDLASTVAARRAGDCTEHATLLAALTRLYEIPSRVVLGMVLVQVQGNDIHAFGHAWTEVHDGSRWKVADAALEMQVPDREQLRVHYLPIRVLDDEGPGHTAAMLHGANVWQVEKVQLSSALRELPGH
jgi:transglutaminase-like putative cysteine protease